MFSYRLKRPGDLFRWASDIAVDAHHAGRGENPHQRLFDSLGPLACRKKARCVTLRALRRCRCLTPTVVADNPTGASVQGLSGVAAWAERLPTAFSTNDHRRKSSPVNENQALFPAGNAIPNGANNRCR